MKIVAITRDGKEFMYKINTVHAVPQKRAQEVCDRLNRVRYRVREGEKWFVYDVDKYDTAYQYAQEQKFYNSKGRLMARSVFM